MLGTLVVRFRNWIFLFFFSGLSTIAMMSESGPSPSADRDLDFARDIRPILEANCNQCHGAGQSMNGLRLDTREAALQGGQSGPAILPGDGPSSLLYRKIVGDAPGSPMPLTGQLPPDQVELIRTWLDQGAPWTESIDGMGASGKKHWAYVKPVRPDLPKVKNAETEELTALYRDQSVNLSDSAPIAASSHSLSRASESGDLTAWTSVAQVLLNLDETISRP